uniref:Uncharacterized protein n=1 Tax=Chelonoidis abingdonii TaxID=106734 RepID=A0A8C0IKJ9_CHEAB
MTQERLVSLRAWGHHFNSLPQVSKCCGPDPVSFQGHKCSLCPENWFWYGKVCYHLSIEWKTCQGSKDFYSSHDSRLLKIESKEELVMSFPSSLTVDTKPRMNAAMGVGYILHAHIATNKMTSPMHCILGQYQGKLSPADQCFPLPNNKCRYITIL